MSKKIASGADVIVLDVKTGSGAFMKTEADSLALAEEMVQIGTNVGRKTVAIVSNMDEPLGFAVGNSLEVIEAINTLDGHGPSDLMELCLELGSQMVTLAGVTETPAEARIKLMEVIDNKSALNKLKELVKMQHGNEASVTDVSLLPNAKIVKNFSMDKDGYVESIVCDQVGLSAMVLGGGRENKDSVIDLGVGIVLHKKVGDYVSKGETLATFYANDANKLKDSMDRFKGAYRLCDSKTDKQKLIKYIVTDKGVMSI